MNNEPVAWMVKNRDSGIGYVQTDEPTRMDKVANEYLPLYTHPAKTLTDEVQEVLVDVIRLLESQRIWNGMGWHYNLIPPFSYLPVAEKVKAILKKASEK